jgi:SAM-dependent methyltransferase
VSDQRVWWSDSNAIGACSNGLGNITERNLTNVNPVQGDATAIDLPASSFDFAHARTVLVNVHNPEHVLSEMVALVRPGGVLAVQDVDAISWTCEPPHPAWDRLLLAVVTVWREGGNPFIGRQLPGLLRALGLIDVGVDAHVRVWRPGDLYQTMLLHFADLFREKVVERGLLTESELVELVEKLRAHLNDPGTIVLHWLFCRAWGRKPA